MEFKEIQEKVVENAVRYGKLHNIDIDEDFAVMKLSEEVGEFFQALLIYRKKCREEKMRPEAQAKEELAHELADILGMALVTASLLNIDLEKALEQKWFNRLEK